MENQDEFSPSLSETELLNIAGGGIFYNLGAFFAEVANAGDSIYSQYGNTNMNHHW